MARNRLNAGRLIWVLALVLCFGLLNIPTSASQIDIVDRDDFVVDIQLTVYDVYHAYYTDGNLDGTVSDGLASDDGHSGMASIVSGITKRTSYGGNSYQYSDYSADYSSRTLTLIYTRSSAPAPTEPPVTEPPVTEPPVTEPAPTEAPATEPTPTRPPATEPEKPVEPPVTEASELEVPEETEAPAEEETLPEAVPAEAEAPPPEQEIPIAEEPVPLAEAPASAEAPKVEAPKADAAPVAVPAEVPTQSDTTAPWVFAARIGAIAVITIGAALLLISITKKVRK